MIIFQCLFLQGFEVYVAGVKRFSKSIVDLILELLPLIWEQRAKEKEETCFLGNAVLRIACIPAAVK